MAEAQSQANVVYFGRTDFRNQDRLFGVKRKDRRQHMYIMGKSGCGKTALLHNLAVQDIMNGDGLCIVDPHGEFVESVLGKIPQARAKDVIYFNPADTDYHIGFNPLELPDTKYKHLVSSGLMAIFTKIWANVWSARMEYIMNNAILALLDTPGSTLLGINRILVDKDYRQLIIANVKDPVVKAFWVNEYETWRDQFRNEAIAPIQNKVGQFLSTSIIRNVVGQQKSTMNIFDIMNTGKIFLVNVSKGRIGEDNSALLGAMLITKIQLAAMERVRIPEDERRDFYLYVDEFQNFATDSFAGILSEARKYRLNLILAHQYIGQLVTMGSTMTSTKVRDAVFGNAGTMLIFRIGAADAEFLENEFSPEVVIEDMVNLPNYSVYLKLLVDGIASRPFSAHTLPPFKTPPDAVTVDEIIAMSRKLYARSRETVEAEISRWTGSMGGMMGEEAEESVRRTAALKTPQGKFPAVCSNCGKDTMVTFKPTPGKPVYCSECFEKVKAAREEAHVLEGPRNIDTSQLAELGIEFSSESGGRARTPKRQKVFEEGEPVLKEAPKHNSISLQDLAKPPSSEKHQEKPKTPHKPHKAEPKVEDLRQALKEALGKDKE